MKFILSRKGFDSANGGGYSPFDPITGHYIVLPILSDKSSGNEPKMEDVPIDGNYLGVKAKTLLELLREKEVKTTSDTNKQLEKEPYVHIDPMLGKSQWYTDPYHQQKAFGQAGAAQSHLDRWIEPGDIFLFYSRFQPMKKEWANVHSLDPRLHWPKGVYFIYGWLKVGKVIKSYHDIEDEKLETNHPHATRSAFQKNKNNTIYLPAEKLFDDLDIPGCGYFPKLTDDLRLSSSVHRSKPSIWELPSLFVENRISNQKGETLKIEGKDAYYYQSPSIGQEWIFEMTSECLERIKSLPFKQHERVR